MSFQPLVVPFPGRTETESTQALFRLVATHLGVRMAKPGFGPTHVDAETRVTVALVAHPTPEAPFHGRDTAISISREELESRRVSAFYVVGYHAPASKALVIAGFATLSEVLNANKHRVVKRKPTAAENRARPEWLETYDLPFKSLRPISELGEILNVLRAAQKEWRDENPRSLATVANGVDTRQVLRRPISPALDEQAERLAESREAKKRWSPETLHATHKGNYGSHASGVIVESLVAMEYGLAVDERVLAKGDGGIDFQLGAGLTVDVKGNANEWRIVPTDVRVKEEHLQWAHATQIYFLVWYSKEEMAGELVGWAFLDEIVRHAPARKLTRKPESPWNFLLPVGSLRPPATFGALVKAFHPGTSTSSAGHSALHQTQPQARRSAA